MRTGYIAMGAVLLAALIAFAWHLTSNAPAGLAETRTTAHASTQPGASAITPMPSEASAYEAATDLLGLIEKVEERTDADSLGMRARALDECRMLVVSPNYFDGLNLDGETRYGKNLSLVKEYVATYQRRCQAIANSRRPTAESSKAAVLDAAAAGNPWANAKLLPSDVRGLTAAEADDRLSQILRSKDGDAISALADYMASPKDDSSYSSLRGSQLHAYAWQLVGCDLGANCSSNGELMRNACIFGGTCGAVGDYRSLLRDFILNPEEFSRVEGIERDVLLAIRSGGNKGGLR